MRVFFYETMKRKIFFLILFMNAIFFSGFARADCFDECMSIKDCWHKGEAYSSYCGSAEVNCERECELKEANRGDARSYGAIAYSKEDGSYGFSQAQDSQAAAEGLALSYCGQYSDQCRALVWFYNSCGAVAADGKKVGWGQADSEEEAQRKALKSCRKARGKNCQVQVSHCSL